MADKVFAFKDELKLWQEHVNKRVFDMFQILAETLKNSEPKQAFSDLVSNYLHIFLQEFKHYFPSAKCH